MHERGLNTKLEILRIDYYKNSWGLNDLPQIMWNKTKIEIKHGD